jgi:hypothetical protein
MTIKSWVTQERIVKKIIELSEGEHKERTPEEIEILAMKIVGEFRKDGILVIDGKTGLEVSTAKH